MTVKRCPRHAAVRDRRPAMRRAPRALAAAAAISVMLTSAPLLAAPPPPAASPPPPAASPPPPAASPPPPAASPPPRAVDAPAADAPASTRVSRPSAAFTKEVTDACVKASDLHRARAAGKPVDFDDQIGMTALLVEGRVMLSRTKSRPGRVLCLFDKVTRNAFIGDASGLVGTSR